MDRTIEKCSKLIRLHSISSKPKSLEDKRNLTPTKENDVIKENDVVQYLWNDVYDIPYNSKLDKSLPDNVGGMLDRLEQMDNVVKVENENGVAYLYPDGRAECFVKRLNSTYSHDYNLKKTWHFPIVL